MSEAIIQTLKRFYTRISPIPDGDNTLRNIDGWIEDYKEIHPHSARKMVYRRELIKSIVSLDDLFGKMGHSGPLACFACTR